MFNNLTELPIELFVDKRRHPARVGEQTALHFWLYNRSPGAIEAVHMRLEAKGGNDLRSLPYEYRGRIEQAAIRQFSTAFVPQVAGLHVLVLNLTVQFDDDRQHTFELRDELHVKVLEVGDAGSGLTIEIEGSALVDGPLPEHVRRLIIKGDALMENMADKLKPALEREDDKVYMDTGAPDLEQIRQVKLQEWMLEGLSPLDFSKLARSWTNSGLNPINVVQFVNDNDEPMGKTCRLCSVEDDQADHGRCDHYRLKIKSHLSGFVTLLLRGTSTKYMVAHPTCHTTPVVLSPNRAAYFPGAGKNSLGADALMPLPWPELPDMDVLCFTGHGVEQALVLVTPQPLIKEPGSLLADHGNGLALQYQHPAVIKALIQQAAAYGQASELGYAEIEVVAR